ncbi:MAG: sulfur transferase domain-containing protein [Pseudomonadota bacterium]
MKKIIFSLLFLAFSSHADTPAPATLKVDLAEVRASASVVPVDGITVAGQPDEAALQVFADSGYTTVIDLRGASENRGLDEQAAVEALGMNYVPLPIDSGDKVNFDSAAELTRLINEADGPVLLHCGSGNRVGALLALAKRQEGASVEESIRYGEEGGLTRLRSLVEKRLDEVPSEESSP